jgi:hypothetical protein
MNHLVRGILLVAAAATVGCAPAPAPTVAPSPARTAAMFPTDLSHRFEVVGRGPTTNTFTADIWAFTGQDGRTYAYTTAWGVCRGCVGDRMWAWDVTDPANPVRTDSVLVDARVVNDVTVNADATLGVITREMASSRRNGIVVLDLSNPAHPTVISEYWETLTGGVHTTFFSGDLLYVTHNGTASMHIIDLSDPRNPREVGRWGLPASPGRYLHDLWVEDGLAYLSYWDDGLVILDVGRGIKGGTPTRPQLVSQTAYRTRWRGREYGNTHMALPYTNQAGRSYVFVGDEIFPDDAGVRMDRGEPIVPGGYLHVFDVTDIERPVNVARYEVPDAGIHNLWVHDDVLYIAYYNAGLRALDVSGDLRGDLRAAGREMAALSTGDENARLPNQPFTMTAMYLDGLIYVADFNSGLWITRLVPNR